MLASDAFRHLRFLVGSSPTFCQSTNTEKTKYDISIKKIIKYSRSKSGRVQRARERVNSATRYSKFFRYDLSRCFLIRGCVFNGPLFMCVCLFWVVYNDGVLGRIVFELLIKSDSIKGRVTFLCVCLCGGICIVSWWVEIEIGYEDF